MRPWSLHPCCLDARGLVAWRREALLAQAVLRGACGYRHHPQLLACAHPRPHAAIAADLRAVYAEAAARGYRFDASRIGRTASCTRIEVSEGQLRYEWWHLMRKLRVRDSRRRRGLAACIQPHPLFVAVAAWKAGAGHKK